VKVPQQGEGVARLSGAVEHGYELKKDPSETGKTRNSVGPKSGGTLLAGDHAYIRRDLSGVALNGRSGKSRPNRGRKNFFCWETVVYGLRPGGGEGRTARILAG